MVDTDESLQIVLCGFSALVSYGLCTGMGRSIEDLKNPAVQISNLLKVC